MLDERKKDENFIASPLLYFRENKINDLINRSICNEKIRQIPINLIDLFSFLSLNLNNNQITEETLIDIIKKIDIATTIYVPFNYFEPLLQILCDFSAYPYPIIDYSLKIIFNLMSKSSQIFQFFSQPIFIESYLNLFAINDLSVRIFIEIIDKKEQILETHLGKVSAFIIESPLSESSIYLLAKCLKINSEFAPIDQIIVKLDEIMQESRESSLVISSSELIHQIIVEFPNSTGFFIEKSIKYLKIDRSDIENISIIKIYNEIVKITKDFSFLFNESSEVFVEFFMIVINSPLPNNPVQSSLFKFLSYDANISFFVNFPNLLSVSIQKLQNFSYRNQKNLLKFVLNVIIGGNKKLLELAVQSGIEYYLEDFLNIFKDEKLTLNMLNVIGLICENNIPVPNDLFQCVCNFIFCKNESIASLATAIYNKIEQDEQNI